MAEPDTLLDALIEQVQRAEKYRHLSEVLVRSVLTAEMEKRRGPKEAVKAARSKLHQVAAAYQGKPIPYAAWLKELAQLPQDLHHPDVLSYLMHALSAHASTRERIPIQAVFFQECLAPLGSVHSILDLACGLNPLVIPWLPLQPGFTYTACDIYTDMLDFLNAFFARFKIDGHAVPCDITRELPPVKADLTLVLKTIPCLEQIDKDAGRRLLEMISSPNILVSFPAHSLGGKSKGMVRNYERRFAELLAGKAWQVTRFEFPGELAFLIQR